PYLEALQIVAERAKVTTGRVNPLALAIAEKAITVQVRANGEWSPTKDLPKIWLPNPYVGHQQSPGLGEIDHRNVQVATADIDKLWPKVGAERPSNAHRPRKYDWEEILIEMARIAHDEGLPTKQAEMVTRIQEWHTKKYGKEPGETEVKRRVS